MRAQAAALLGAFRSAVSARREAAGVTLLAIGGFGLVAAGVALYSLPAGLIVGGLELLLLAVGYLRGAS